uniref:CSON004285 protein n=1 Tax=Culicoides sonorensis TaxID=179676 RepID=A0A336MS98_CULSO
MSLNDYDDDDDYYFESKFNTEQKYQITVLWKIIYLRIIKTNNHNNRMLLLEEVEHNHVHLNFQHVGVLHGSLEVVVVVVEVPTRMIGVVVPILMIEVVEQDFL